MYRLFSFIKKMMDFQRALHPKWINGQISIEESLKLGLSTADNSWLFAKRKESHNSQLSRSLHLFQFLLSPSRNKSQYKNYRKLLPNIFTPTLSKSLMEIIKLSSTKIQVFLRFSSSLIKQKGLQ